MFNDKIMISTLVLISTKLCSPGTPITIDGLFDDWASVPVVQSDATGLASGVHYYILTAEENYQIKKMTLLK